MPTRRVYAAWGRSRSVLGLIAVAFVAVAALVAFLVARDQLPNPNRLHALAGTAAGTSAPIGEPSSPLAPNSAAAAISKVPGAMAAAKQLLTEKYDVGCLSSGYITYYRPSGTPDKIDERIAEAKVANEGWISEGTVWVGSPASAVEAFEAEAAFDDGESLWIVRITDKGPQARELFRIDSASGKATWRMQDQVAECDSTDPASDDDEAAG